MEIRKIGVLGHTSSSGIQKETQKEQTRTETKALPMPGYDYYHSLSFTGGKSLSLERSVLDLIKIDEKNKLENTDTKSVFPLGVLERAQEVIKEGNPEKKTLIDIHNEVFKDILSLDSLEELRFFYPEFQGVKDFKDVPVTKNSFVDDVAQGKIEHFKNPEELPLDLVKLVYAQGFSLSDLKEYTNGKNIYSVFEKYEIPTLHREYAKILKLSDPDYNERFTSAMSEKRTGMHQEKKQRLEGEPVFIPSPRKGVPLSDEHKKKISEGLLKYYAENPASVYSRTERQKQYYTENPEQAEIFRLVMLETWRKSYSIAKAISKHFKNATGQNFEIKNADPASLGQGQKNLIKEFWDKNPWAKSEFSKNMKAAWPVGRELYEKYHTIITVPLGMQPKIEKMAKESGYSGPIEFGIKYYSEGNQKKCEKSAEIITNYYDKNLDEQNIIADTFLYALHQFAGQKDKMKNLSREEQAFYDKIAKEIDISIHKYELVSPTRQVRSMKEMTAMQAQVLYSIFNADIIENKHYRFTETLNGFLNQGYSVMSKAYKEREQEAVYRPFCIIPKNVQREIVQDLKSKGYKGKLDFTLKDSTDTERILFKDEETDKIFLKHVFDDSKTTEKYEKYVFDTIGTIILFPETLKKEMDEGVEDSYKDAYRELLAFAKEKSVNIKKHDTSDMRTFAGKVIEFFEEYSAICEKHNVPELVDIFTRLQEMAE